MERRSSDMDIWLSQYSCVSPSAFNDGTLVPAHHRLLSWSRTNSLHTSSIVERPVDALVAVHLCPDSTCCQSVFKVCGSKRSNGQLPAAASHPASHTRGKLLLSSHDAEPVTNVHGSMRRVQAPIQDRSASRVRVLV